MSSKKLTRKTQRLLADFEKQNHAWYSLILPAFIVLMAVLCVVLSYLRKPSATSNTIMVKGTPLLEIPRILALSATQNHTEAFIVTELDDGKSDLFYCTITMTDRCNNNLTQTPSINELWPVLHAPSETIAYYGVGDLGIEIFLFSLPVGPPQPITLRSGTTGLHKSYKITTTAELAFSPDGKWIAFPAQAIQGDALEVFIARNDGLQVKHIEDKEILYDYHIQDYLWMDSKTLLLSVERPNGSLKQWLATIGTLGNVGLKLIPSE